MRVDVLTILPKLLEGPFSDSILKRAQEKGICQIHIHNIRQFSKDKHQSVDDYAFGGSAGMVMTLQPIVDCIESLTQERQYDDIIYVNGISYKLESNLLNRV